MVIGTAKAYSSGVIHDVMMEALHRFSSSVWPTSVYTWLSVPNAQEAGCHSSCEYFLLVLWGWYIQQCCFLPNPIKPLSFVACFSWLAHLQVRIPHCCYLSEGLTHTHTLLQGEPGSEPYICVTFTCELGTTCDMYCRLWIHCWFLALMEWSSRCLFTVYGVLFLCWCQSTGGSDDVLTGLHTESCIPPRRLHYL